MRSDKKGCSVCLPGQEKYETFTARVNGRVCKYVQYDYRGVDGKLFSTVASKLETCRARRDAWLVKSS